MRKILISIASVALIIILGLSYLVLKSPDGNQIDGSIKASIVITRSFGKELIQEDNITLSPETSALEALKMIAEVETDYGGGFVSSINGIRSSYPDKLNDWFFYVNGFLAKEGASSYIITDNDLIQWDYHSWESPYLQYAATGSYPYYFKGYAGKTSPTAIVFEEEFSNEAAKLKKQLTEKFNINVKSLPIDEISEDEKSKFNVIIIAKSSNILVKELNEIHERIGFFVYFEEDVLVELDHKGNPREKHSKAGVIQVTQNIWNPKGNMACENVIMIISGTDSESIMKSVDILTLDPMEYRYSFSLIITDQGILKTPYLS